MEGERDGTVTLARWVLVCWIIHAAGSIPSTWGMEGSRWTVPEILGVFYREALSSGLWVVVLALALRFARTRRALRLRDLALAAALAVALALGRQVADDLLWCHVLWDGCPGMQMRVAYRLVTLPNTLAISANFIALGWAIQAITLSRENGERARRSTAELHQAQMSALERQLRPHFLFNALQSVNALVEREPAVARDTLLGLRALLGHSVQATAVAEVPVRDELQIVDTYLGLEKRRFGERLQVRRVVEPAALECLVPPFLLQPLVENAVHHAVQVRGEGTILVHATTQPARGRLDVVIRDTGPGGGARLPRARPGGVGLHNARSRLELLYGDDWDLSVEGTDDGGSVSTVSIPLRHAAKGESVPGYTPNARRMTVR